VLILLLLACTLILLLRLSFWLLPESLTPLQQVGIVATLAWLMAALEIWLLGATGFRGLYGDDLRTALWDHTRTLLRAQRPAQIIEDGTTVLPKDAKGPQMGPRMVILRGTVATLYRGAKLERVVGPGMVWTKPWEYVAHAHNARPMQDKLPISMALTRFDHIPISAQVEWTYRLALPDEVVRGERQLTDRERDLMADHDLAVPDLQSITRATIEQEVRRAVAYSSFDTLMAPHGLRRLDHEVRRRANLRLRARGITIQSLTVTRASPTDEMMAAASQGHVEKTLEEARAEAWRSALRLLADGYVTARETIGMTDDDLKREVLRRVLDALARSPKEANAALSASVVQSLVNGVQPYPGVLGVAAQAPQGKANGKP
jgi:hypothetical protein